MFDYGSNFSKINAENERLVDKLREAEAMIEMQNSMEKKIVDEYKDNVERIRAEIKNKNGEIERLTSELDKVRKRKSLNISQSKPMIDKSLNEPLMNSIVKIEGFEDNDLWDDNTVELEETKDLYKKQTEMAEELFKQVQAKDEDKNKILKVNEEQSKKIK